MHDEELASCTVRMHGSCHGKNTCTVFQIIFKTVLVELSFNGVSRTTHAGSVRASALDHEAFDDAMENQTVVEAFVYQADKVIHGVRSDLRIKFCFDDITIFHFDGNNRILCHMKNLL